MLKEYIEQEVKNISNQITKQDYRKNHICRSNWHTKNCNESGCYEYILEELFPITERLDMLYDCEKCHKKYHELSNLCNSYTNIYGHLVGYKKYKINYGSASDLVALNNLYTQKLIFKDNIKENIITDLLYK